MSLAGVYVSVYVKQGRTCFVNGDRSELSSVCSLSSECGHEIGRNPPPSCRKPLTKLCSCLKHHTARLSCRSQKKLHCWIQSYLSMMSSTPDSPVVFLICWKESSSAPRCLCSSSTLLARKTGTFVFESVVVKVMVSTHHVSFTSRHRFELSPIPTFIRESHLSYEVSCQLVHQMEVLTPRFKSVQIWHFASGVGILWCGGLTWILVLFHLSLQNAAVDVSHDDSARQSLLLV